MVDWKFRIGLIRAVVFIWRHARCLLRSLHRNYVVVRHYSQLLSWRLWLGFLLTVGTESSPQVVPVVLQSRNGSWRKRFKFWKLKVCHEMLSK